MSAQRILDSIDKSLHRLGTDWVDVFMIHWPDRNVPFEETMNALEETVQAGKVRFVGVSNFRPSHLQRVTSREPSARRARAPPSMFPVTASRTLPAVSIACGSYSAWRGPSRRQATGRIRFGCGLAHRNSARCASRSRSMAVR